MRTNKERRRAQRDAVKTLVLAARGLIYEGKGYGDFDENLIRDAELAILLAGVIFGEEVTAR
jgi:hypothetical protein